MLLDGEGEYSSHAAGVFGTVYRAMCHHCRQHRNAQDRITEVVLASAEQELNGLSGEGKEMVR
jgi:hypothetical protein